MSIARVQTSTPARIRFSQRPVSHGFFTNARNRRYFFDWLRSGGNDLYKCTWKQILSTGARRVLAPYADSPSFAVMCEYPEVNWLPWQFKSPPRLWWVTLAESFYRGDPVAIAKTREYYETQEEPETGFPPSHPFEIYFGGVSSVRRVLFENKFAEVSSARRHNRPRIKPNYLMDAQNRRYLLERVQSALQANGSLDKYESLYNISKHHLYRLAGPGTLKRLPAVTMWVKVEFPEHAWETWKFFGTPKEWWHQIYELFNCDDAVVQAVVRQYVEHIEKDLVAKLSTDQIDWKRISEKQLDRTAAKHFRRLGGFRETIQKLFPELGVRKSHLGKKLAVQLQLRAVTNSLFPIENEGVNHASTEHSTVL